MSGEPLLVFFPVKLRPHYMGVWRIERGTHVHSRCKDPDSGIEKGGVTEVVVVIGCQTQSGCRGNLRKVVSSRREGDQSG